MLYGLTFLELDLTAPTVVRKFTVKYYSNLIVVCLHNEIHVALLLFSQNNLKRLQATFMNFLAETNGKISRSYF